MKKLQSRLIIVIKIAEKLIPSYFIREATSKIFEKLDGNVRKESEAELLNKLLGLKDLKSAGSLGDLISSMQVEKDQKKKDKFTRADMVRKSMPEGDSNQQRQQRRQPRQFR